MSTQQRRIRETDEEARGLAQHLVRNARFGALGVIDPQSGAPMVSRVSVGTDAGGTPVTLISELSLHTQALLRDPACSLLIGEPGPRGDALIHPRLTLQCTATPADKAALKPLYLSQHPKAALYFDFSDFLIYRLLVAEAHLNGGFGKAFHLGPADLGLA